MISTTIDYMITFHPDDDDDDVGVVDDDLSIFER